MVYYNQLPLSNDILQALTELKLEYVFQPIFEADGKTIYAREALMRPTGKNVTELIQEYTEEGKLHILEVATFFGAMQAYILRGYEERISINSFPSECFSEEEEKAFDDYFGDYSGRGIIEILEYPHFSLTKWQKKKESLKRKKLAASLDDYGSGINDMNKVQFLNPEIVKIDRTLISNINADVDKQRNFSRLVNELHDMDKIVVAEGVETKEEFDCLV